MQRYGINSLQRTTLASYTFLGWNGSAEDSHGLLMKLVCHCCQFSAQGHSGRHVSMAVETTLGQAKVMNTGQDELGAQAAKGPNQGTAETRSHTQTQNHTLQTLQTFRDTQHVWLWTVGGNVYLRHKGNMQSVHSQGRELQPLCFMLFHHNTDHFIGFTRMDAFTPQTFSRNPEFLSHSHRL